MQVTETLSEHLKRAYTVVVPATAIESRRLARLTDLGKTLQLPGFRPGKVPLVVVRQRFGKAVGAEVLEQSIDEAVQQVLNERGLRPAIRPKIDLVSGGETVPGPANDLEFKVELEVIPEIALPDFGAITLTRRKAEASPELIDKALGEIARRNGTLHDISDEERGDRGAEAGETLTVDYVGRIDGTEFPGGKGTDVNVEISGSGFIPGFVEQLTGMRPGETRRFEVIFPADYGSQNLAGKQTEFEVTAKALKRLEIPAVDNALAERIGFELVEEVRDFVRRQIQREYDGLSRFRLKRELLDRLNDLAAFPAPEGLVEAEFAQIWARLQADRDAGRLDEEDKTKDEQTLRADYRAIAERRVRLGLLLAEVGRVNGIEVGNDEMTRAMRAEAARYPGQEARIMELFRNNPEAANSLRGPIFEEKVVDYMLELAQVREETVAPEELAKETGVA